MYTKIVNKFSNIKKYNVGLFNFSKSAYKCHMKFKHEGAKEFCDQESRFLLSTK